MSIRGLIGVVHLPAMPGDPSYEPAPLPGRGSSASPARTSGGFVHLWDAARRDAQALAEGGVDAIIVENFGSAPFPKGTPEQPTPPHQLAAIARAVLICLEFGLPVGVNVLRNDVRSALGIAAVCGASFVRVNVHVGAYVTDQGLIEGRAFETLRYRRELEARGIAVLADVRVKHATPLAPLPIESEVGDCVVRGGADGVIVTGVGTGAPVSLAWLEQVRAAAGDAPVYVGSGLEPAGAASLTPLCEGAIVGTWVKEGGDVRAPVDPSRVRTLVEATRGRWRRANAGA